MKISIIIPVFNERDSINQLYAEIVSGINARDYEIIFIDDGSTDKTASIVQDIKKHDESICLISFDSNSGKSAALNAGFEKASGDIVLTMDADLQDDPREISNLISKLNQGWDVVSGWKKKRNDPLDKTIPSKLFNYILE